MYRKSLAEKKMENEQFLTKVHSIPVVTSLCGYVTSYVEQTKEKSQLMKYTLDMAEKGAKTGVSLVQPLMGKLEPQISFVNAYACKTLEDIQDKYPVILKPTEQVVEQSKEVCLQKFQPAITAVESVKDSYNGVKNYGYNKVNDVKGYATGTVVGVASYGTDKLNTLLETRYGQTFVDKATEYVEHYLPAEEEEEAEEPEKEGEEEKAVSKVVSLSGKVRRRMYTRAMRDMQAVQKRSKETLEKLHFTVDLIQYAKDNIDAAKGRLDEEYTKAKTKAVSVWEDVISTDETTETGEMDVEKTKTFEGKAIYAARILTVKLRNTLTMVSTATPVMPEILQKKFNETKEAAENMFKIFREAKHFEDIPAWILEATRTQLHTAQETLNNLTEYALSTRFLNWMVIDIDIDHLEIGEPEDYSHLNGNAVGIIKSGVPSGYVQMVEN